MNGAEVTKTDSRGFYGLDGMKSGTYTLSVKAPSIYFNDVSVNVLPSEPTLPLITPSRFVERFSIILVLLKMNNYLFRNY